MGILGATLSKFKKPVRKLANKVRFRKSVIQSMYNKYNLKPLEQIEGTCWFYSILNIIKHSTILKNNIAYSIMTHKHLMEDAKKTTNNASNRCSVTELYHKTLQLALSGNINENGLKNFISKLSRSSHFREISETSKLTMGGYPNETIKTFRNLLRRLKLPQSTISTSPANGYTLAGSLITFNMVNKVEKGESAHVIAGVINSNGRRKILNSAYPNKIYNINWNKNLNMNSKFTVNNKTYKSKSSLEVNKNMRNKWSMIPWSNTNNFNSVYNITKIYVKKLY